MSDTPPESPETPPQPQRGSRHPLLAIGAAGVVLVIVLALALGGSGNGSFVGREAAASMAKMIQHMDASQFEVVEMRAGEIGDWILTKGFDGFRVPSALAHVRVSGRATTKSGPAPVAVLMLDNDTRRAAAFQASPAGIELPEDGSWHVFEVPQTRGAPDMAVAASADNGICFVVSAPGKARDLERWLQNQSAHRH